MGKGGAEVSGVQYLSKILLPPKWMKGGNIPKNNIVRLQVRKSKDKGRVMYGLLS